MAESTLVRAGMTPAERCRYVADLIEAHPENFDMGQWLNLGSVSSSDAVARGERPTSVCGTRCCIAGWAVAVTPKDETPPLPLSEFGAWVDDTSWIEAGAALLALGVTDARALFLPDGDDEDDADAWEWSVAEAAFLLRWHADELDRA